MTWRRKHGFARRRLFPILVFLVQHSVHSVSQYTEREAFQKEIGHPQLSLMSGYSDDVVTRQALQDAGNALLQKPFLPEALLRAVREALTT